jgi:hypothetical protein
MSMYYSFQHRYTKAGDLSFISMTLEVMTLTDTLGTSLNRMESAGVSQWLSA